ncbi:MAG: MarR family winged helix-turn-helix transcriptional regulator [bacterium]|nr:MarR family winged helix-turn-helix transcriptional regulator [bacterium]
MPDSRGRLRSLPAGAPDSDDDPLAMFTTLARTGLFLEALQRESLQPHGLSFNEYSVLRLLQRAPERALSPKALSREIVCTSGAMTKLLDRLQRARRVRRRPDPDDRRGVLVELTRTGDTVAEAAAASYREGRERILERLRPRDVASIGRRLTTLLEGFEADYRNAGPNEAD